jgi:hypothetical protein
MEKISQNFSKLIIVYYVMDGERLMMDKCIGCYKIVGGINGGIMEISR